MSSWACVALLLLLWLVVAAVEVDAAFEWSSGGKHPEVDRWALAGLWKLTPRIVPMKEFTVYPKRPVSPDNRPPELLLMLKEDGSFQQYDNALANEDEDDDEAAALDVDTSWHKFQTKASTQQLLSQRRDNNADDDQTLERVTKGTWDYVDGKLILAADRPDNDDPTTTTSTTAKSSGTSPGSSNCPRSEDHLLVGRVVATYETPLAGNPVLQGASSLSSPLNQTQPTGTTSPNAPPSATAVPPTATKVPGGSGVDAHLSVPRGSLKIGRFLYPKHHPSFFEQPMFQPTVKRHSFSLQQVLGNLNARSRAAQESTVEKYQPSDFFNKTFFLTSHPLPPRKVKRSTHWSIKLGKFVDDVPSKNVNNDDDDEAALVPIRVLQVAFHRNHTFSTVAGLGESIVLRGKWDVIGTDKDQLWMQVWRFGFGRSVSGSTYSEGQSLTHEDAKCYWGTIRPEGQDGDDGTGGKDDKHTPNAAATPVAAQEGTESGDGSLLPPPLPPRLEVRGSVMFGWGLEPLPVARFIMRESTQQEEEMTALEEEEDDDDDDESLNRARLEDQDDSDIRPAADGIDWSDESFQ